MNFFSCGFVSDVHCTVLISAYDMCPSIRHTFADYVTIKCIEIREWEFMITMVGILFTSFKRCALIITFLDVLRDPDMQGYNLYTVKTSITRSRGNHFKSPNHPKCELNSHFGWFWLVKIARTASIWLQ